jgi:hypothetical protein
LARVGFEAESLTGGIMGVAKADDRAPSEVVQPATE